MLREEGLKMTAEPANRLASASGSSAGEKSRFHFSGWAVCFLWGILAAALLTFAWHCWPVLDGDAINFVPNMVTYANDGSLLNAPSPIAQKVDSMGGGRLIHHGFLYEMVVGKISLLATYPSVIMTMALIEVLSLGACAFVLYRAANVLAGGFGWARLALVAFGLGGTATALIGLQGRPEPFGILLVASAASLIFLLPWRWHFLAAGGVLGLMAATHPVGTLLCCPIAALYASARCAGRDWFAWLAKAFLVSLAAFAAALAFYPYHLREWIEGLLRHYSIVSWHYSSVLAGDRRRALYYWLTVPRATFFGPLFLMSLVSGLWLGWRFRDGIRFKTAFVLSGVAFLIATYFFAVRNPQNSYNLQVFTPLIYGVLIVGTLAWFSPAASPLVARYRNLGIFLVLALVALTNLGFLRDVALFPFFLKHGFNYTQARASLQEIRANWPGKIGMTQGLFSLTEDYRNLSFESEPAEEPPLFVVQQVNSSQLLPWHLKNYELLEDHFSRVTPRCFGVKLGNTVGGYNFAVYRRTDLQRKQKSHE